MSKALWQQSIKNARSVTQRCPVVIEDKVLATFNYGQGAIFHSSLLAIDATSGAALWQFDANHFLNEPVIDKDGFIYQTCFDGSVYKLNARGEICWRARPSTTNTWGGVLVNNLFVYSEIAGQAKFTRGLECATGKVLWEYEHGGHAYSLASDNHEYVVHASISGSFDTTLISLLCLNANSGKLMWRAEYEQYIFRPTIHAGHIYLGARGCCLIIDLQTGNTITKKILGKNEAVELAPLLTKEGVIFISNIGKIYFYHWSADEFVEKWSLDLQHEIKAKPIIHQEKLFLISENSNLISIDLNDGSIVATTQLPHFTQGFGLATIEQDLIISASPNCARIKMV